MTGFHPQTRALSVFLLAAILAVPLAVRGDEKPAGGGQVSPEPSPEVAAALKKLKLPGVKINLPERCVDVESSICLDEGMLELIACTKDTKEHESIVAIEAKPSHVHTALLLLGAKPGNPAARRPIDEEGTRWIDIPPRGGPVDVFLVFKNEAGKVVEHPISKFIAPAEDELGEAIGIDPGDDDDDGKFPTHTLLFAGSILHGEGPGPRKYLADGSGHVITIATFGDELLCLPGIHSHSAGQLIWQVDGADLPAAGAKVTLRLRPQAERKPAGKAGPAPEK